MISMQIQQKATQMDSTEALWTLIQSQSKAVRKVLTARLVECELQNRLEAARKDIKDGKGKTFNSKEDLLTYLDTL